MRAIESAFARLTSDASLASDALARFRAQMRVPPRVYHTEAHVTAVLDRIFAWTDVDASRAPGLPLVVAALYHDVVYDATRGDNETQSAAFATDELTRIGVSPFGIARVGKLILATQHHQPGVADRDAVLLVDADLYILGSDPETYAAYVAAIRAEYAHVTDDAWRAGRRAVLERFLQRPRIYRADWQGCDARETQARTNLANEIASLT